MGSKQAAILKSFAFPILFTVISCSPAKFDVVERDPDGKVDPTSSTTIPGSVTTTVPGTVTTTVPGTVTTTVPGTVTTTVPGTVTTTVPGTVTTTSRPPTTTAPPVTTTSRPPTTTTAPPVTTTSRPPTTTTAPPVTTTSRPPTTTVPPVTTTTTAVRTVTCQPRINGSSTSITLNESSASPTISANCVPNTASCSWIVRNGSQTVVIPGLNGCTSTPNFAGQNPGTYNVFLTATFAGYTDYVATQPLVVTIGPRTTYDASTTKTVTNQDNELDILLVIDDSKSMAPENQKLAQKLQGFVADLSTAGFDWQMCVTLTRAQQLTASNPNLYWGASRQWVNNPNTLKYILKSGTANADKIFQDTMTQIGAGWAGTDDERAIKGAWWHLWNGEPQYSDASGCYRKNAGLSVIILSDEDERSVGGDCSQEFYANECKPLESDDYPQTYVNYVRSVFGQSKRFNVNSIIVQPGDTSCMSTQDSSGSKSHYGYKYKELSGVTNGGTGSICSADYSAHLKYFKDQIIRDMGSLPLECQPVSYPAINISPSFTTTTRVENGVLYFSPKVPAGRTIRADYKCAVPTQAAVKAKKKETSFVAKANPQDGKVQKISAARGIASEKTDDKTATQVSPAAAGGIRSGQKAVKKAVPAPTK